MPVDPNGMCMHSGIHVAYWDADYDRPVLVGLSIVAELATILQGYQVKCRDREAYLWTVANEGEM